MIRKEGDEILIIIEKIKSNLDVLKEKKRENENSTT